MVICLTSGKISYKLRKYQFPHWVKISLERFKRAHYFAWTTWLFFNLHRFLCYILLNFVYLLFSFSVLSFQMWMHFSILRKSHFTKILHKNPITLATFKSSYIWDDNKYFGTNTNSLNTSLIVLFRLEIKQSGREQLI